MTRAALIVFAGLPGTGKTTLAQGLVRRLGAAYLRIDVIEQAIRDSLVPGVGPAGYAVAQALAVSNLRLGRPVVADGVNPVGASRAGWQRAAWAAEVPLIDIVLRCGEAGEHRRRVEQRRPDVAGLRLPDWAQVMERRFEAFEAPHLALDTAGRSVAALVAACAAYVAAQLEEWAGPGPG